MHVLHNALYTWQRSTSTHMHKPQCIHTYIYESYRQVCTYTEPGDIHAVIWVSICPVLEISSVSTCHSTGAEREIILTTWTTLVNKKLNILYTVQQDRCTVDMFRKEWKTFKVNISAVHVPPLLQNLLPAKGHLYYAYIYGTRVPYACALYRLLWRSVHGTGGNSHHRRTCCNHSGLTYCEELCWAQSRNSPKRAHAHITLACTQLSHSSFMRITV